MRRLLMAAVTVCALGAPAAAETLVLDAGKGLAALNRDLSAIADPSATETFSLGAVQFLRAVEGSLQARYRSNAAVGVEWVSVPLLRLPFEPNPDPEPFRPEEIRELFASLLQGMVRARTTLEEADLAPGDGVEVDLAALWLDVNADGARGEDEGLLPIVAGSLADPRFLTAIPPDRPGSLTVRFDAADVDWLVAYTHFLSAVSEFVIAFDPTEPIRRMIESRAAIVNLRGDYGQGFGVVTPDDEGWVDALAAIYGALNKVPDQPHLAAARDHFLGMVRANRAFWEKLAAETDDDREWIPNATQTAALGFEMPPDTGTVWLQVLAEAEAVLTGELLVGHWRLGPAAGINLARLVEDPPAVDVVKWFQGQGLQPYMEKGPLVSWASFRRFTAMFRGEAILFMVLLN